MKTPCTPSRGFTLLELSIVLVVIGLIVGGLLVGESLIRASELQAVIKDINQFRTATNNFKGKYASLPGDMPNATNYWGTATVCNIATASTYTAGANNTTCNGDGNGQITMNAANTVAEMLRYWQHLSLSGMLPGNYTGIGPSSARALESVPDLNAPSNALGGTYYLYSLPSAAGFSSAGIFDGTYNNFITIGPVGITSGLPMTEVLLFTPDAVNIDRKIDDGKPGTGAVIGSSMPTCSTTTDPLTAEYDVTLKPPGCVLRWRNIF